jgi:hypothetical protein
MQLTGWVGEAGSVGGWVSGWLGLHSLFIHVTPVAEAHLGGGSTRWGQGGSGRVGRLRHEKPTR